MQFALRPGTHRAASGVRPVSVCAPALCAARGPQQAASFGSLGHDLKDVSRSLTVVRSEPSSAPAPASFSEEQQVPFAIVNFYWLTDVADPEATVAAHKAWIKENGIDLTGRIYIAPQGINAQYSGPTADAVRYAEFVKGQPGFGGLEYAVDPVTQHMFPKLRLKTRKGLISMAGGTLQYKVTDPEARATPLQPEQWREMMGEAKRVIFSRRAESSGAASTSGREQEGGKDFVVLDLRNDYEYDLGHFEGADRPAEDEFAQTPTDGSLPGYLEGKDPENTNVLMYCTGGIRCDIYSTYLKEKGFKNLYTLHRGVANYFREEGDEHWKGSMFVFDGRMAVQAGVSPDKTADGQLVPGTKAAVNCQLCGQAEAEAPHCNCGNVDCNKLFLACPACKDRLKGCCCEACIDAPRLLRPMKARGLFGNWTHYVSQDVSAEEMEEINRRIASGRKKKARTVSSPAAAEGDKEMSVAA